jgi:NADPH:quinone reductase-like Zn-dependent oxidoreductase
MRLRYKIANAGLVILALALSVLLFSLSHNSPCEAPPPLPAGTPSMKAAVHRCYGSPDVITMEEVAKPVPADNEVLVKVHAASVNPLDWRSLRGEPYVMRLDDGFGSPTYVQLGVDFAGTVEAVGKEVTRFRPGDEVFGGKRGSLAEYVSVSSDRIIMAKPSNLTFEQAAAVPIAAITALQALRDRGRIRAGQKVLINGASGGVGTFAVQIAKAFDAEVTGVCSTRNVEMVRSLGADHIVDYTREDFTRSAQRYDLIVDNVGNRSVLEYRRVMLPDGVLVIVGATDKGPWIGVFKQAIQAMALSPFLSQEAGLMIAQLNQPDLRLLAGLLQSGKVRPVIDRRYSSHEIREAVRYLEGGHARGKVVVTFQ